MRKRGGANPLRITTEIQHLEKKTNPPEKEREVQDLQEQTWGWQPHQTEWYQPMLPAYHRGEEFSNSVVKKIPDVRLATSPGMGGRCMEPAGIHIG